MLNKANLEEIFFMCSQYTDLSDKAATNLTKEIGVYVMELWQKNREQEISTNNWLLGDEAKIKANLRSSDPYLISYALGAKTMIEAKIKTDETRIKQANE